MSTRDFLTNLTIILGVMAVAALIETIVPMFLAAPWKKGRRAVNLALTTVGFLFNWLLSTAAAVAALSFRPAGLLAWLNWPAAVEIGLGIVVIDFSASYLSHRVMHEWPVMWRFHQIHHSDPFVDVTTTYRTHPVETVWRFLFAVVPIWLLGIPAQAVMIQRLLQSTFGVVEHANIRLWAPIDRLLSQLIVTPNVHKIHHSRLVHEANSNYANILTVYDRLLGTYTPASRAESVVYGLDHTDAREIGSFSGLLTMPFRPEAEAEAPDTKVRVGAAAGR